MRELLIAGGGLWVKALVTGYLGPLVVRGAALGCFAFAAVLLLLAGTDGSVSPAGAGALFCVGAGLWTLGHVLYRLRYGFWATRLTLPLFSGRLPSRRRSGGRPPGARVTIAHG